MKLGWMEKITIRNKNEKTFRDRGTGFVEISSYRLWDNKSITRAQRDKTNFQLRI